MTFEQIVQMAKDIFDKKDVSARKDNLAVEVCVEEEGSGTFYIELKDGKINVEPYNYNDHDCRLIASADTLLKLVSGKMDAVLAFTLGKLRVERSIEKALEFAKIIKG